MRGPPLIAAAILLALGALGLGAAPPTAGAQEAPARFSVGDAAFIAFPEWRIESTGPSEVTFEALANDLRYSLAPFDGKIAGVSVDLEVADLAYQQSRVLGAGLIFCTEVSGGRCAAYYTVLLTSDDTAALWSYADGGFSPRVSFGVPAAGHAYKLRVVPDEQRQGQIRILVNGNDLASVGNYAIPRMIGVIVSGAPGSRIKLANFHVERTPP